MPVVCRHQSVEPLDAPLPIAQSAATGDHAKPHQPQDAARTTQISMGQHVESNANETRHAPGDCQDLATVP
jgi:hypothetical protein